MQERGPGAGSSLWVQLPGLTEGNTNTVMSRCFYCPLLNVVLWSKTWSDLASGAALGLVSCIVFQLYVCLTVCGARCGRTWPAVRHRAWSAVSYFNYMSALVALGVCGARTVRRPAGCSNFFFCFCAGVWILAAAPHMLGCVLSPPVNGPCALVCLLVDGWAGMTALPVAWPRLHLPRTTA